MSIFYKPADGVAADFIPLFWEDQFHLFYLKDYRDIPARGEGTPWFLLQTADFVHFDDRGESLARGGADEQDLYVFTGCALRAEGRFHIFYTGHNPHLRRQGRPEQAVLHAVSDDLVHWQKLSEEAFFAPEPFEPHDWRDPFVFWNEEAGEYWMLTAARLREGPSRRRGCTALSTSKDLVHWSVREPFYAPGLYFTHECPDLFRIGEWWYLVFSEFSEGCLTRYRMSRSLSGPWLTPAVDSFDGRAYYAAKTAANGSERYLFGWNPTRSAERDTGDWNWGGNLVVHRLEQQPDGSLAVCLPQSVGDVFSSSIPVRFEHMLGKAAVGPAGLSLDAAGGYAGALADEMPPACRITARVSFEPGTQSLGVALRMSEDFESGYFIRMEPLRQRLVFDRWPRPGDQPYLAELERPLVLIPSHPVEVEVLVEGSLCEVYVDHKVAMSVRMYEHTLGAWGFFCGEGRAEFTGLALSVPQG